jgi:hypothetical protein
MEKDRPRPPRPPLCLEVGVTGHRRDVLPESGFEGVRARLGHVFASLAGAAQATLESHSSCFVARPPALRLASPLADGADQIAAEAALAAGFELQAVLPFPRADYLLDFEDEAARASSEALLGRAARILELPGDRTRPLDAYIMAGRATVAHSEIMVAIWDGLPARGRGGTGEVVEQALRRGAPVIHVPIETDSAIRLLWTGFDPLIVHTRLDDVPARPFDQSSIADLLERLLAPPQEGAERAYIAAFYEERDRQLQPRIEYPLLLALTGAKGLARSAWRADRVLEETRAEWESFRGGCLAGGHGMCPELGSLEEAYGWSDRLAQHFAQSYRSGHVFNFLFGGLIVVLALSALLMPGLKVSISFAELLLIAAVIANTRIGTRREWHRRWLDYRQLAERLRPMRSLAMLGLAQPGFAAAAAAAGKRRWVDWYAGAMWRAAACPSGPIAAGKVPALAQFVSAQELRPQVAYHRASAVHIRHLDHRLHLIGTGLFVATIAASALFIIGYYRLHDWTMGYNQVFVFLSGALPALGTAIFGIRVQGEFSGTADRSLATAERLESIAVELEKPGIDLPRAAGLMEEAARTMLADLGEWRLAHQQRKLVIPA